MKTSDKLTATFESWKLTSPHGDVQVLPGKYEIRIQTIYKNLRYRCQAYLVPTNQEFLEDFAESKLDELKAAVRSHFERQITEWK